MALWLVGMHGMILMGNEDDGHDITHAYCTVTEHHALVPCLPADTLHKTEWS